MSSRYTKANDDEFKEVKKAKPSKWVKRFRFIYNRETGQFCGRTCRSWGLLVIYFLCFYVVLAALFMVMMHVFLTNVIPVSSPLRTGENSILEFIPGVNMNPRLSIESGLIVASINESSIFHKNYLLSVEQFFNKTYRSRGYTTNGINCSDNTTPRNITQFCLVDKDILGPCADPLNELRLGRICVFVRINKIYGWVPNVENKILSNDTFVFCEAQYPGDANNLGTPMYYPSYNINNSTYGVISNMYFPFINQMNYSSPVVAVQFPQMTTNLAIQAQCSLRNLRKHSKPVKFEVMLLTVR